jgi:hypothetical protein
MRTNRVAEIAFVSNQTAAANRISGTGAGLQLQEPCVVGSTKIQSFDLDPEKSSLVAATSVG